MKKNKKLNIEKIIFTTSLISLFFLCGVISEKKKLIPSQIIDHVINSVETLYNDMHPFFIIPQQVDSPISRYQKDDVQPGLTKLTHINSLDKTTAVSIIDSEANTIHQWNTDWFSMWNDTSHLLKKQIPHSQPGGFVHGAHIFANGDLVFNFEFLGMMKLDICGNVLWELPKRTHHSIALDDEGNIWTGIDYSSSKRKGKPGMHLDVYLPYIAKISPEGELLEEKSVFEILANNGLHGAMYQSSTSNRTPIVRGDTMHLNDIEVFTSDKTSGFFVPGDIMISLRNPNLILILEPKTWRVKHSIQNLSVRQHDPDFIDGDTISVYDNNNRFWHTDKNRYSRIISINVPENIVQENFRGSKEEPFFSDVLGKHQWLENGNLLFSASTQGKALEVTADGEIVWEFFNILGEDKVGFITEVERLPENLNTLFFKEKSSHCIKEVGPENRTAL